MPETCLVDTDPELVEAAAKALESVEFNDAYVKTTTFEFRGVMWRTELEFDAHANCIDSWDVRRI